MKRRLLPPRRVLVTGGATNIGRAITECFLPDGARVAVGQLLRPTTDDLVKVHGKKVVPIQFDQGRAEDCQRAVAEAVDALDGLDVLAVLYRMLERHGWRKVAPDTRHPKAGQGSSLLGCKWLKEFADGAQRYFPQSDHASAVCRNQPSGNAGVQLSHRDPCSACEQCLRDAAADVRRTARDNRLEGFHPSSTTQSEFRAETRRDSLK